MENASEHPIAAAIACGAAERLGALPSVTEFANSEGLAVRGVVDGHAVLAGRPVQLEVWSQPLPTTSPEPSQRQGRTRSR